MSKNLVKFKTTKRYCKQIKQQFQQIKKKLDGLEHNNIVSIQQNVNQKNDMAPFYP